MSFAAASAPSDWVEIPMMGIKVNIVTGLIVDIDTNTPIPIYRNRSTGTMIVRVPKNKFKTGKGLGKGLFHQIGRVVLYAVNDGVPAKNPRQVLALPKDGNKWNIRPENLEWITVKEHKERQIVDGLITPKLDVHRVFTVKDVVSRLAEEGIRDRDAIAHSFNLHASSLNKLVGGSAWGFAKDYVKEVTVKAADYQMAKAREAAALFADYDRGLAEYIVECSKDLEPVTQATSA